MDKPLIDMKAAAQLAEIDPDYEVVHTWRNFRVLVGALSSGESVLEFRKRDGSETRQYVLDSESRAVVVEALSSQMRAEERLIVP